MKKCLIYLFVAMLCTGNTVLAQAGQFATTILGSGDDPSSVVLVQEILLGDAEERSEEDAQESEYGDEATNIVQELNLPCISTIRDLKNSLHFIACMEHFAETPLLPPEL